MDKIKYHNFQFYETDEIENYLTSMEKNGFALSQISGNFFHFIDSTINNIDIKYKVLYYFLVLFWVFLYFLTPHLGLLH